MTGALVLITGTGRSGTSTMSGAFHHLGLSVPGPYLGANESNPKGFFESSWAVRFHKQITKAARIHEFDSRPTAYDLVQAVLTPEHEETLTAFLREQRSRSDQVVVKDPRSVWVQSLWRRAAASADLQIRYVSMLRHPAEVVGSRTTYYAKPADERARRRYETFNVARWVNGSLVNERETRGQPRAFVSYDSLLEDWRGTVRELADRLDLRYPNPPVDGTAHPVDDFVDPGLRRHRATWGDLEVPPALQALSEAVWAALAALSSGTGAPAALDRLSSDYRTLFDASADIAHDATEEARDQARRAGARAARAERSPAEPAGPRVGDLGSRQLLGVVAGRALGSLRSLRAVPPR